MSDWDYREVCPDGACIGVIGDDGLCKVCGRAAPNWGDERKRGLVDDQTDAPPAELEATDEPGDEPDDDIAEHDDASAAEQDGDDWDQRELCDNGACTGVISSDGTCSVCGSRPADAPRADAPRADR